MLEYCKLTFFHQALEALGIVTQMEKKGPNGRVFKALTLVSESSGQEMDRIFKLMFEALKDDVFDPLKLFSE